ncbi:serine hydrolase domain-containing protein [Nitrospira sp. M1]
MDNSNIFTVRIDENYESRMCENEPLVPWWSFTKTVLAVCALQLFAQGRLSLDSQVNGGAYTLRQLLQHRAGVRCYGGVASYHRAVRNGEEPWSVERLLAEVEVERPEFSPNQGWSYSNVGYLIVRQMIEEATGDNLQGALKQIIFAPLGLSSAKLATQPEDLDDTAWGNENRYHPGWVYHGLVIGTPYDATCFLHMLMTGKVLGPELLSRMTQEHRIGGPLLGRPWMTTGYGLGLMMGKTSAGYAIGHSGCGPGSVAAVYHFSEHEQPHTISAFTQGYDEGVAEQEVVRVAEKNSY